MAMLTPRPVIPSSREERRLRAAQERVFRPLFVPLLECLFPPSRVTSGCTGLLYCCAVRLLLHFRELFLGRLRRLLGHLFPLAGDLRGALFRCFPRLGDRLRPLLCPLPLEIVDHFDRDLLARLDLLRRTGHRQVAVRHHAKRVVLERASLVGGQPGAHGVDDAKFVGNLAPDLPHGFRDSRRVPTLDDDTGRGHPVSAADRERQGDHRDRQYRQPNLQTVSHRRLHPLSL